MKSGVQIRNADTVVELKVYVVSDECIDPLYVHLKNTISEIKERVCDEVTKQIGKTFACEPEQFMMVLSPDSRVLDNDSTKTLGQVLIDVGIINVENIRDGSCADGVFVVRLCPTGTGLRLSARKEEREEEDYMEYHEGCLDEDCIYPEEEIVILDPEDAFSVKRPDDGILPADTGTFRVCGELVASRNTDQGEKKRYIPYNGLTYPLERVNKLSTSASLVLLAFNSANLDVIGEFTSQTRKTSKILTLQVSWDKFSYLFLRKLRQDLCPHVPIVAVTDLDVRHLDLLAFLDTAPHDLLNLYGRNLSQDCAHFGVCIDYLDIKWLGIRPSDSDDTSDYHNCFAKVSHKLPHDFKEVYEFLLDHPYFSSNSKRVQELHTIAAREVHRSLPYLWQSLHWYAKSFVWENYLPTKIANKDWI